MYHKLHRVNHTELLLELNGNTFRLVDEFMCQFGLDVCDRRFLDLSAEEFTYLKSILPLLDPPITAFTHMIRTWRGGGTDGFDKSNLPFFNKEYIPVLVEYSLITDEERNLVESYAPPKPRIKNPPKPTFIYLMRDDHTQYIKIGRSNNPTARERTLQAESPSTVLLECWASDTAEEKVLHDIFAHKRKRGEWFELDDADVNYIYIHFHNKGVSANG